MRVQPNGAPMLTAPRLEIGKQPSLILVRLQIVENLSQLLDSSTLTGLIEGAHNVLIDPGTWIMTGNRGRSVQSRGSHALVHFERNTLPSYPQAVRTTYAIAKGRQCPEGVNRESV